MHPSYSKKKNQIQIKPLQSFGKNNLPPDIQNHHKKRGTNELKNQNGMVGYIGFFFFF
jgi:hypothetical protein